ncbi:transketolase [candidate division KSB1 bacterium]|nr:transketolase [candidate division KSB1 bacterium]
MNHEEANQLAIKAVNSIRFLAIEGVEQANSGHPGMPMGMADVAYVLWTQFLRYNPDDPKWLNRDRFVLSAGHGSMLIYAMLHLSGYDLSLDDLKNFRQYHSKTPGHPELGHTPGVETTTGPLGQGFSNGVGMALAAKIQKAKFPKIPIDTRIFTIVSDGDLMEGVSSEAASIAGHLGLGNLIYIYDDNQITIEGSTELAFSENVQDRFNAYGWHTVRIDGHNHSQIDRALSEGIAEIDKPTLILARTKIGFGSPNKQGTAGVHGAPLGPDEIIETKKAMNWPLEPAFYVPDDVRDLFKSRADSLKIEYDAWKSSFAEWKQSNPDQAELLQRMYDKSIPDNLEDLLIEVLPEKPAATRAIGGKVVNKAAEIIPSLYGGSADLSPSTKTDIVGAESITKNDFSGRNLHFGIREHAMGSLMNGMVLYGGFIPYGSTFMVFADYMRPPMRLAAIMKQQAIYIFTHDSIFVGEDGPTHQPVEHLASLRLIPRLTVFRPADGLETAMAWAFALRKKDGPTVICLTRQSVPILDRLQNFDPKLIQKGGYILSDTDASPDCILVATGSEVGIAIEAQSILRDQGVSVRVVSMPSVEAFNAQDESYKNYVISQDGTPVAVVEAGISHGWHAITRSPFLFMGMSDYGESGPYQILAKEYGFTGEAVAGKVGEWLKKR